MYGCKLINGGGVFYFVILMWEWYSSFGINHYARQKTLTDVLGASLI